MSPDTTVVSPEPLPRLPVSEPIKQAIRDAFAIVPEGKRSAVLGIADIGEQRARLLIAWKVNETWKVGGEIGISRKERPDGWVGIVAAW